MIERWGEQTSHDSLSSYLGALTATRESLLKARRQLARLNTKIAETNTNIKALNQRIGILLAKEEAK
ncbi:hypothetical protein ACHAPU_010820 [Fusarium lateritium]